ncbi:hypothetical protein SBA2_460007 [Acidobacteriia bacterium SbA2]|nr:hypothetical protein SBA2_460007 [Acidobacteriia bacterium SbA2]
MAALRRHFWAEEVLNQEIEAIDHADSACGAWGTTLMERSPEFGVPNKS